MKRETKEVLKGYAVALCVMCAVIFATWIMS